MTIPNDALFYGAATWLMLMSLTDVQVSVVYGHQHMLRVSATDASTSYVLVKYRNTRRPWGFLISQSEARALCQATQAKEINKKVVLALVCRQDGVCCLDLEEVTGLAGTTADMLGGKRVSINRSPRGQYQVAIERRNLARRIPLNRWPTYLVSEQRHD